MFKKIKKLPSAIKKILLLYRHGYLSNDASERQLETMLYAWAILEKKRGYRRSLLDNRCVDGAGNPIPWYTYPAMDQLEKWDFSAKDILEYGSGHSTIWWGKRARSVTSIESNIQWYELIKDSLPNNCNNIFIPVDQVAKPQVDLEKYIKVIDTLGKFDVIIIDGEASDLTRLRCTQRALDHLNTGGLIIIDNSDWLPESCRILREAGFIEIDFCGLVPLNPYASTTSVFFKPGYVIAPRNKIHPGHTIGGYAWDWETKLYKHG